MIIPGIYKKSRNIFYQAIEPLAYVIGGSGAIVTLIGKGLENNNLENLGGDIFLPCVFYLLGARIKDWQFQKVSGKELEEIASSYNDLDKEDKD